MTDGHSHHDHDHDHGHGHGHGHGHSLGHDHSHHVSSGNLKVAFLLNLGFTLIEVAGGLWTNSIAILSDAVHDLGDSLSLGCAWYFDRLSRRGRSRRHTYGFRRYSLLGGLITAVVLLVGLSFVLWSALGRLFSPQEVNAPGMMALAVLGVAFNGAAVLRVRKGSSLTERVVSWHLLEDTLGWVAVLVGAGAMAIWDVPILDPLLSIGISLFVLWNVLRTLKRFVGIFLQRTPPGFDLEEFEREVRKLPGVISAAHTHSWSIDGDRHVLTTHLVMPADVTPDEMAAAKAGVRNMLEARAFEHVTIDIEREGESVDGSAHRGTLRTSD